MLFKYGSGTGTNFSSLRQLERAPQSGGGRPARSAFMKGYDAFAGVIKSGGKTRRAAKMVILNARPPRHRGVHPQQGIRGEEGLGADRLRLRRLVQRRGVLVGLLPERQPLGARHRRVHAGRCSTTRSGSAARPVDRRARDGRPTAARELMAAICEAAWVNAATRGCSTTRRSTTGTPASTRTGSTRANPCSEYMFLDDTACNLASAEPAKFVDEAGEFDVETFRHAVRIA
jgi:ribonucleoside-diphosphate reductase alpha chain